MRSQRSLWRHSIRQPCDLGQPPLSTHNTAAVFGIIPLGRIDPTARALGAGWKELGAEIDELRVRMGAPVILDTDYGLNGWLAFYVPSHPPVEQINDRIRYVDAPLRRQALRKPHPLRKRPRLGRPFTRWADSPESARVQENAPAQGGNHRGGEGVSRGKRQERSAYGGPRLRAVKNLVRN